MKHLILAALSASLIGCAIEEDDFPDAYAAEFCDRMEECDVDNFNELWSDEADCESDAADVVELWLDLGDLAGETYDGAKGRDCVSDLKGLTCDEIDAGDHECDLWSDE